MPPTLKTAAHIVLFIVAVAVFYVGLGVGLTANPTAGTLLWLAAAAIIAANIVWLVRSRR